MPATEQTYYALNVLHRVFAVASVALLAASIWLLVRDHRRPWKTYQRTAQRIERRMAAWRQSQFDPPAGFPAEPAYVHFDRGFPRPGRKLLELPFLDAFNSPLRIENLWAEGLTQDFHFRQVPRFDRCTTCHTASPKTAADADSPAYPQQHVLRFRLAAAPAAGSPDALSPQSLTSPAASSDVAPPARRLDDRLGLRLADEGLLQTGDVTIACVRPATLAAAAEPVTAPPSARSGEQILRELFQTGDSAPSSRPEPGLRAGDVLIAIDGVPVADRQQAVDRLLAAQGDMVLTVRRGLPQPFSSHPRLDLFLSERSPHRLSDFACTVCHGGQGSATDFAWAAHAPNDPAQRRQWRERYGWFDQPFWDDPMHPRRFLESGCVKCHHRVVDLQPSPRYPQPPAPKLVRGYTLLLDYGCFGCHEINGFREGRSVGPDVRREPPYAAVGRELAHQLVRGPADDAADGSSDRQRVRQLALQLVQQPDDSQTRRQLVRWLDTELGRSPEGDPTKSPWSPTVDLRGLRGVLQQDEPPGRFRPPGPSLRYLSDSVPDAFLHDWLRDPRRFRPATRMPRSFGLWDHLDGPSRQRAERYEPLEIRGIVAYLRDRVQDPSAAAASAEKTPAGIAASTAGERSQRGRVLFQTRGCLACHSHAEFAEADGYRDPQQPTAGPDLSNLADKLTGDSSRSWLTDFVRRPIHYLPTTIMPDLLLDPIPQRDAAGSVVSVTDPAEDLAEFLLQPAAVGYQRQSLPALDLPALTQLTREYLQGVFHESQAREYAEHGIPAALAGTLQVAERELLAADRGGVAGRLSNAQKLRYVGRKTLGKYGCFGCHDIPGFEAAVQIGPPLSDWGRRNPQLLAFEQIDAYAEARETDPAAVVGAAEAVREAADTAGYFRQQLAAHNRIGFAFQKLTEPRSYDYRVVEDRAYHDRLRMPQFPFSVEEREAIITFLLGLVAQPPAEKYVHVPDAARAAIIDGQELLDRYQCATCHVLEPQTWQLAYPSGAFRPQPDKSVFPWVDHRFDEAPLLASRQADARGLLHATLAGMPAVADNGRPLVFDDFGDELFEDEDYPPGALEYLFQLWQPAALDGRGYQVGRGMLTVLGDQILARQRAKGGFLAQYLLPHVTRLERAVNPSAKGSEAWGWLPPPLVGQGDKVQSEWLYDYLLAPSAIRPASRMRMPKYHLPPAEAQTFVDYFAAQARASGSYQAGDRRNRAYLEQAQAEYARRVEAASSDAHPLDRLAAAMRIVTDKNYCITCHIVGDFDPQTSERAKAPNLADVYQRFRPDYLRRWLADPATVLPYTAMPVIVPYQETAPERGGVAQTLYPGTSIAQLDALVDLLMNFDRYARRRASVAPLIGAASPPISAAD